MISDITYYFEVVKLFAFFRSNTLEELLITFSVLAIIANIDGFLYKTILEKNTKEFIKEKYNEGLYKFSWLLLWV